MAHSAIMGEIAMLMTPGPWRVSDHDDCEIYAAHCDEFIGSIARAHNARAISMLPDLIDLVLDLAERPCGCGGEGSCSGCRAQRIVAVLSSLDDAGAA